MNYLTRYYVQLNQILEFINQKFQKLKNNFLAFLFCLFLGFLIGNLFGTLVDSIRKLKIADNLLIFILIFLNEFINFVIYSKKSEITSPLKIKLYNLLNLFKIGSFRILY